MKKIFFIAGIAAFSFVSAQENGKPHLKIMPPGPNKSTLASPEIKMPDPSKQLLLQATLSDTLPNGNKVYLLPQDNMPCIVPDMSQYNMPVIKPDMSQYNMPNPANPPKSKFETIPSDKLKELLNKNIIR